MTQRSRIDTMAEATRLTRAGRLTEAVALLRGTAVGGPEGSGPSGDADATPSTDTSRLFEMQPPSADSAGAWTASETRHDPGPSGRPSGRPSDQGVRMPMIPATLRERFGRMKQRFAAQGFGRTGMAPGDRVPVKLPDGARFEERSHTDPAGTLAYKLYIPSGYSGQPLPLVVMLHGCTQTPDDFAAGTRMNLLAEEQVFLVAYPAQSMAASPSRCWQWFSPEHQQRGRGEPALIAGMTGEISRELAVDPGRVYLAGLSAGGAAAAVMGATYPELYAAIGIHSGLAYGVASDMPSALAAMRQGGSPLGVPGHPGHPGDRQRPPSGYGSRVVPTIVFHGDRDTTVTPINADQVIAQSQGRARLGKTVSHGEAEGGIGYTRSVHADATGRALLEQWVLHGAGHAWSGGSAAGSFTEPRGPDASREMLRFFMQQDGAAGA